MDLSDQTACRERVKVLEMMEELQRLRTLREKRESKARAREYATHTVATRAAVNSHGTVVYLDKTGEQPVRVVID